MGGSELPETSKNNYKSAKGIVTVGNGSENNKRQRVEVNTLFQMKYTTIKDEETGQRYDLLNVAPNSIKIIQQYACPSKKCMHNPDRYHDKSLPKVTDNGSGTCYNDQCDKTTTNMQDDNWKRCRSGDVGFTC